MPYACSSWRVRPVASVATHVCMCTWPCSCCLMRAWAMESMRLQALAVLPMDCGRAGHGWADCRCRAHTHLALVVVDREAGDAGVDGYGRARRRGRRGGERIRAEPRRNEAGAAAWDLRRRGEASSSRSGGWRCSEVTGRSRTTRRRHGAWASSCSFLGRRGGHRERERGKTGGGEVAGLAWTL